MNPSPKPESYSNLIPPLTLTLSPDHPSEWASQPHFLPVGTSVPPSPGEKVRCIGLEERGKGRKEGAGRGKRSRHGLEQEAIVVNTWDMRRREGAGVITAYQAPDVVLSPPTLEGKCD